MRIRILAAMAVLAVAGADFGADPPGPYSLYASLVTSKGYVVGARLPPSGIFRKSAASGWRHLGFNHPFVRALDYDPRDPDTLYVAAGNGLIRVTEGGTKWKILTGNDVTELSDVAVDPSAPDDIYFTHTRGIRASHDRGATWMDIAAGLHRKYSEAICVDRLRRGVLLAGNEEGIFRSEDQGRTWRLAGAAGLQVLRIQQSPHEGCRWLAGTQGGGLFVSSDCGATFESAGDFAVGQNVSDIAFDPWTDGNVAAAGWGFGIATSDDGGKTWHNRSAGLPSTAVWSVVYDPARRGRVYAAVHEEALYVSDDSGAHWTRDGLEGSRVWRMRFVPESRAR